MTSINTVAQPLLDYLRDELDNHTLQYHSSPTLLQGGYANQLFLFQLTGSSDISSHKLVLRLLSPRAQVGQASIEGTVQQVLHHRQFPTPSVFAICDDPTILGGAFIVMGYAIGELMLQAYPIEVCPEHLASIHLQLHRIDPQPVVTQLARRKIVRDWHTFIGNISSQIQTHHNSSLAVGLQWVRDNVPSETSIKVICHGDFHPYNILVHERTITAVLDWACCYIHEPEFDVANTLIKLSCNGPGIVPSINWSRFTQHYLNCYTREYPLTSNRLTFYEAVWCLWMLAMAPDSFLQLSGIMERLTQRFQSVTGLTLTREQRTT